MITSYWLPKSKEDTLDINRAIEEFKLEIEKTEEYLGNLKEGLGKLQLANGTNRMIKLEDIEEDTTTRYCLVTSEEKKDYRCWLAEIGWSRQEKPLTFTGKEIKKEYLERVDKLKKGISLEIVEDPNQI